MADKDRQDAANQTDDNEEREENGEQQSPPRKAPESQSAPAPGDDIIIK